MTLTVVSDDTDDDKDDMNLRASTVRGHAPNNTWLGGKTYQTMPRNSARVEFASNNLAIGPSTGPKKSVISHLEDLISSDPHRSKADDVEKSTIKRLRAGSMTDLQHMLGGHELDTPLDQIVENDIDDLYQEVKRKKDKENKDKENKKQKEKDVSNAIDAALGI